MEIQIGQKAPSFLLNDSNEKKIHLEDFQGKWIVLYFYPKDNTSGCSLEAMDFTRLRKEFEEKNSIVIGISPDSCQSHRKFIEKKELNVLLLSDPEKEVIKKFGCWVLKKMYGKEYYGVERSTFILSPDLYISKIYRKVKAKGHAEKVLSDLGELQLS